MPVILDQLPLQWVALTWVWGDSFKALHWKGTCSWRFLVLGDLTMKLSLSSLLVHLTGINHEALPGKSTRIQKGWQCPVDTACWHCPHLFPDVTHAITWKNIEAWRGGDCFFGKWFLFLFYFFRCGLFLYPCAFLSCEMSGQVLWVWVKHPSKDLQEDNWFFTVYLEAPPRRWEMGLCMDSLKISLLLDC